MWSCTVNSSLTVEIPPRPQTFLPLPNPMPLYIMLVLSETQPFMKKLTYLLGFFLLAQGSKTYLRCVHFCPIRSLSQYKLLAPSPSILEKVSKHTPSSSSTEPLLFIGVAWRVCQKWKQGLDTVCLKVFLRPLTASRIKP